MSNAQIGNGAMNQIRVFISSTSTDLQAERQATRDAIYGLDQRADDMIFWSADERGGARYSLDRVAESDVLILILAHRYGQPPPGEEHSITELEYRAARAAEIPVLAFFVDPAQPWPPDLVDWESRDQLRRFKQLVESEVTRKVFRTPEELARQVTQALAVMLTRRREARSREPRTYRGPIRVVTTPFRLPTDPDLLIQIGSSADGLPLLLDIYRGRDLSEKFASLAEAVASPAHPAPEALLATFRQSLEDFATQAWAGERMRAVTMRDGTPKDLYVSTFTLVEPFSSVLAGLFGTSRKARRPGRGAGSAQVEDPSPFDIENPDLEDLGTVLPGAEPETPPRDFLAYPGDDGFFRADTSPAGAGKNARPWGPAADAAYERSEAAPPGRSAHQPPATSALQSVGGRNRFLGVAADDGAVYSVGMSEKSLVEWRPFFYENILALLPDAALKLRKQGEHDAATIPIQDLKRLAPEQVWGRPRGPVPPPEVHSWVEVSRLSVLSVVALIADALTARHSSGVVHGDVKPQNVLVTEAGVVLIDSFDVPIGGIAPGWTPSWSAPEQVLGRPMTTAADVYPLGLMVARALGGQLTGEIRRYRTPRVAGDRSDFDVVHNPSLFIDRASPDIDRADRGAWRRFVERALKFDASERTPTPTEFALELRRMLREHPVQGTLRFAPPGKLVAAQLADGETALARLISDPLDAEIRLSDRADSETFFPSLWHQPPPPPENDSWRYPNAPASRLGSPAAPPAAPSAAPSTRRVIAAESGPAVAPAPGRQDTATASGPTARCVHGHASPAGLSQCVICGADLITMLATSGPPSPPRGAVLICADGRVVPLEGDLVLGRTPEALQAVKAGEVRAVTIDNSDRAVSRVHAMLRVRDGQVFVRDLSANGTYVAASEGATWSLVDAGRDTPLARGSRIRLGGQVFVVDDAPG